MGHAHHFLSRLDRISSAHVELALEIYRDDALLRFLLADVGLPEGAERAAISLEDPREGPFLVVTREGRFVTCLGKGMRAGDLPVVTRAQLDGRMARVADRRQKSEARERIYAENRTAALLQRTLTAGDELSCEEFAQLSALQPILAPRFLQVHIELADSLENARPGVIQLFKRTPKPRPAFRDTLRNYWNMFWGTGHLLLLGALSGPEWFEMLPDTPALAYTTFGSSLISQGILTTALRGAWATARLGKPMLAPCKQLYEEARTYVEILESTTALAALGLRHSKLRAEVRKALSVMPPAFEGLEKGAKDDFVGLSLAAFDHPEDCERLQRLCGARDLVLRTARNPPGSPLRYQRMEDVPVDLAMRVAIHDRAEFIHESGRVRLLFAFLPWVARASAEDLYLPADLLRVMSEPWEPRHTYELVQGWIAYDKLRHDFRRQRAGPARKAPCPCGSGKKYKHCCEGKKPVPA